MFLTDEEIADDVANKQIIENYDPNMLGAISYDISIEKILVSDSEKHDSYLLEPGATVFISSKENINLPNNLMGFVNPRNSCIRMGLSISAPIYQPGHHTKIFIRVSNLSDDRVVLRSGASIASIMFSRLSKDVASPYQGPFTDEFSYKGVGDFHSTKIPDIIEVKDKLDSIKDVEKNMYTNVMLLVTIFIGIFSLINLNIEFLRKVTAMKDMIIYNFISLGGITTLVSLISMIIPSNISRKNTAIKIFIFAIILLSAAIGIFFFL